MRDQVRLGARRIALVAPTTADARAVMVEGESGILAVSSEIDVDIHGKVMGVPEYEPSNRRVVWANGAQAFTYSAERPDRLRGPQHDAAWCDELAAWESMQDTWDMLQFTLRLGDDPKQMITTTPRPLQLLRQLLEDPDNRVSKGSTYDNAGNLSPKFIAEMRKKYEGTKLGRQELLAELLTEVEGSLWPEKLIKRAKEKPAGDLGRVVVGVDPSGGAGERGIVAAGKEGADDFAILGDYSGNMTAERFGRRVIECVDHFGADAIVVEKNFGGDMATQLIQNERPSARIIPVTATRGKHIRAEPVSALYEQGRVRHVAGMVSLEDQMRQMTANGWEGEGKSPDRLDGAVWAITELMGGSGYDILRATGG